MDVAGAVELAEVGFVVIVVVDPARVVVGRWGLPQSLFAAAARSPFGRDETHSPWFRAFSHVMTRRVVGVPGCLVVVVDVVIDDGAVTWTTAITTVGGTVVWEDKQ